MLTGLFGKVEQLSLLKVFPLPNNKTHTYLLKRSLVIGLTIKVISSLSILCSGNNLRGILLYEGGYYFTTKGVGNPYSYPFTFLPGAVRFNVSEASSSIYLICFDERRRLLVCS
jgi:hypothetical protein